MNKGYAFESYIEDFFLKITNQTKQSPLLVVDNNGETHINRSFRVPASGALSHIKGDVIGILPRFKYKMKVECKHRFTVTKKDGQIFIVEKNWITKNNEEAIVDGQLPILAISFKKAIKGRIWFITYFDIIIMLENNFKKCIKLIDINNIIIFGKKNLNNFKIVKKNIPIEMIEQYIGGKFYLDNKIYVMISEDTFKYLIESPLEDK